MTALVKKCRALDGRCADKWACARYYVPEGPAGYLDPEANDHGCRDFLRLGGHLGPPGRNGAPAR